MKIKFKDEPIFVTAALCICFPVGVILLIKSTISAKCKWIMGVIGGIFFAGLLSLGLIGRTPPSDPSSFQLTATRTTLSVGQSGGFIITNKNEYYIDYTVSPENDVLMVNKNLYTAVKPGLCTLSVTFENEIRTIKITVDNGPATDSIVLASPSGERYHLQTANHAGKRAVEMTEEEALRSGKTPCKNCYK